MRIITMNALWQKTASADLGICTFRQNQGKPLGGLVCDRRATQEAVGNGVSESRGEIERGQSAEIDFRSGGVAVGP
jgi:hypothetical protein